jgi:hypothetical protein
VGVLGFAVWQAFADVKSDDFDNVLINLILAAGEKAGTLRPGTVDTYRFLMTINLIAAYFAAGLLLVYLATVAIPLGEPTTMKERLAGFQFVIAIGAAVLAVTVHANQKAVDLATLAIDPKTGEPLIEAARVVLDFWSTICVAFLFTAICRGVFRDPRQRSQRIRAGAGLGARAPHAERRRPEDARLDRPVHHGARPGVAAARAQDDLRASGWRAVLTRTNAGGKDSGDATRRGVGTADRPDRPAPA